LTFRSRLRLFFTIIVIVPMIAVALVLFVLTGRSETGKADASIAAGLRNAFAVYNGDSDRARPELRAVAADPDLRDAVLSRDPRAARQGLALMLRRQPSLVSIELYGPSGLVARAGSPGGVASASAPLSASGGRRVGTLSVSTTTASAFVTDVARLSGRDVSVFRGGRRLGSTVSGAGDEPERGSRDESRDFTVAGRDYRGRVARIREPAGPPVDVAVFQSADEISDAISNSRLAIGGILLAFLLLALASSVFVVRALQDQVGNILAAARRLAGGDFKQPVPTEGSDEFAELGREFNSMSHQLEAKIGEVESKRRELEETIRRVGDAFASGLDRQGVAELAVATAVDACGAEAGRVRPRDGQAFVEARCGSDEASLTAALDTAERMALEAPEDAIDELPTSRLAVGASANGAHARAVPMRARTGSPTAARNLGVVSIARRDRDFSRQEEELLEYLAGQAGVSIENADLHETVQRQAVTDELTGLSNVRQLHITLDREVERSRRFASPLGLVMLDIDDFKLVNDEFGHQQGDEVLSGVARVLRRMSRDIDEPARYGGEELSVVLPGTDSEGAAQLAERMREAVERLRLPRVGAAGELRVTASFGVASIPECADDKDALIAAADAALYQAKRAGKNRVERAEPVAASR
jgi:diguanylate cyclase (GGDEF)-like protein